MRSQFVVIAGALRKQHAREIAAGLRGAQSLICCAGTDCSKHL
jgi:hypothetical protein